LNMGFTRAIREELVRVEDKQTCCRMAAVAGLVHTGGTFLIRGGSSDEERYEIHVATTLQGAAKLVYSLFKALGVEGELLASREPRFRHRLVYEVHLPGCPAALQALNEMGVLSDNFELRPGVAPWIVRKTCCKNAFLRGCLIGAGSANNPQKEAHLEIMTPHRDLCSDLVRLLAGVGLHPGQMVRRGAYVVYLKGRDEVAGVLALAGAHEAALAVQEQAVVKEVRARANRVANCDSANVRRTGAAASRQLEAIGLLERSGRLGILPPALRAMAELRLAHPYMNLSELAEAGGEGLSRSAVNHRLRRLVQAAGGSGRREPS
jgi:DNA-binding protein WhiA